jgi:hypothetical protein
MQPSNNVAPLRDMGARFCVSAARSDLPFGRIRDEDVFQNLHWGLELLLKAFLQARGWTDERCKDEVGHDLNAGLEACEREGLEHVDPRVRALLAALSQYSSRHRVMEFVAAGARGWTAGEAIAASTKLEGALRHAICLNSKGVAAA